MRLERDNSISNNGSESVMLRNGVEKCACRIGVPAHWILCRRTAAGSLRWQDSCSSFLCLLRLDLCPEASTIMRASWGLLRALIPIAILCSTFSVHGQPVIFKRPRPVNAEVDLIKCQTCSAAARNVHIYLSVNQRTASETRLLDFLEQFCDPYREPGEWIPYYQIIEEKGFLSLKSSAMPGKCQTDCATISKACTEAIEDSLYELAEYCINNKAASREQITQVLCNELSDACQDKPPKAPADWKPRPFVPATEEDVQMDQLRRLGEGKVQVLGSDEFPQMMREMSDMENVDMGTEEYDEADEEEEKNKGDTKPATPPAEDSNDDGNQSTEGDGEQKELR